MAAEARKIGSTLLWPAIAGRYDQMATKLVARHQADRVLVTANQPEVSDGLAQVS